MIVSVGVRSHSSHSNSKPVYLQPAYCVKIYIEAISTISTMSGQILRQRYRVIQKLGAGGFGETFLAEDLDIPVEPKPKCVVKRIQPQMMDTDVLRMFEREAQTLYNLGQNHNQIPKLFAYFQENGEFYLIQEFIDGNDLSQEITLDNQWSEVEVIKFLREILEVLAYLHQNNMIHRDIKPANIMRQKANGKLILIDFGIVKEISTVMINASGHTSRTAAIGTLGYMPSEQALGRPKFSSDIYALGMTAIQALTGIAPRLLPEDNNGEVVWQDKAYVSEGLVEILSKMVRYDFRQRYADANEVLQVLNQAIENQSVRTASPRPIKIGDKYGYIDRSGLVIQPQFDYASKFSKGLATVEIDGKWGYIDQSGRIVIQPQFDQTSRFSEGLSKVKINSKWGYIDQSGRIVIQPQFDQTSEFSEGLASLKINGKWGYIGKSGRIVIQPQFESELDYIGDFSEGLATVEINGKYGYIDKSGRIVIQPQFDNASKFSKGLATVEIDGKYGYIDKTGRIVIQPQFDEIYGFSEGLAAVGIGYKWGYINKTGRLVIQPQFDFISLRGFSEGLSMVKIDGKWGYIDKAGRIVIQPQFNFSLGEDAFYHTGFSEGLATFEIDYKWGYIDKSGSIVIQPQFDQVEDFLEGIAKVEIGKQQRYIDKTGKFIY
ncbi:WG repeat-containing protein [Nostoc sp. UHCC 0302]|uniref:WG repeat-containing protein n=1 Tax=Nostoc sp. UHCC 0302 TaxID=3134896 RepID=UPI00311C9D6E